MLQLTSGQNQDGGRPTNLRPLNRCNSVVIVRLRWDLFTWQPIHFKRRYTSSVLGQQVKGQGHVLIAEMCIAELLNL